MGAGPQVVLLVADSGFGKTRLVREFYDRLVMDADAAVQLYRDAMAKQIRNLGPQHPDTVRTVHNLAVLLRDAGRIV